MVQFCTAQESLDQHTSLGGRAFCCRIHRWSDDPMRRVRHEFWKRVDWLAELKQCLGALRHRLASSRDLSWGVSPDIAALSARATSLAQA